MEFLKKYRHVWIIPVYMVCYMAAFVWLENRKGAVHILHTTLDDKIPFCRYFIIPYLLWFAFVAGTVIYFAFFQQDREAYFRFIFSLGTGMTLFLAVSYLYPNGHDLRPILNGNDIFTQAVRALYLVDTPSNILPSIHVFNALACLVALLGDERCRANKKISFSVALLAASIVLSTMFLKQHSVIDVFCAIVLNVLCYVFFYKVFPDMDAYARAMRRKKEAMERYTF